LNGDFFDPHCAVEVAVHLRLLSPIEDSMVRLRAKFAVLKRGDGTAGADAGNKDRPGVAGLIP
jgi:hypothetical protein